MFGNVVVRIIPQTLTNGSFGFDTIVANRLFANEIKLTTSRHLILLSISVDNVCDARAFLVVFTALGILLIAKSSIQVGNFGILTILLVLLNGFRQTLDNHHLLQWYTSSGNLLKSNNQFANDCLALITHLQEFI